MNRKRTSFFCVFLVISLLMQTFLWRAEKTSAEKGETCVATEILVKYKNKPEIEVVKDCGDRVGALIKKYRLQSDVEYAEPNYVYRAALIPSDTYYNNQWYLQKIRAVEAWDKVRDNPKAIIAVLDSGVQTNHPDLKDNIWINKKEIVGNKIDDDNNGYIDDINGWDFVNNVADPGPKFEKGFTEAGVLHGTIVAGVAAAYGNNAAGIAGVSWRTQIMPLKVLNDKGEGNTLSMVKAIDYAINKGADIINFSLVGTSFSQTLEDAIKRAYRAGIIIVAAGGNEEGEGSGYFLDTDPMYPACDDGANGDNMVIGVAATDTIDQKLHFSSYGSKCLDISAPGIGIYSTAVYDPAKHLGNKYFNEFYDGYWSGTSMATPIISGAIALVGAANPSLSGREAVKILMDTSDNINRLNPNYVNQLGRGRVNVYSAVSYARDLIGNFNNRIITVPMLASTTVEISNNAGLVSGQFDSYASTFRGGVNMTSGDIDGDGNGEIIVAPRAGGGPHIRVFDNQGKLKTQFFAYENSFTGGVSVASGDIDGDGKDEIITVPLGKKAALVKIFNEGNKLEREFYALPKDFLGGATAALGDVDGDGKIEIVIGSGRGVSPTVKIFNRLGQLKKQFFAYSSTYREGINVATGDIDGGLRYNSDEIIVGTWKNGGPQVRIFSGDGKVKNQFFAYNSNFRGGVSVAATDLDGDGLAEIITGAGPGGSPHVRSFEKDGVLLSSFYAYPAEFSGGVNVAGLKFLKN